MRRKRLALPGVLSAVTLGVWLAAPGCHDSSPSPQDGAADGALADLGDDGPPLPFCCLGQGCPLTTDASACPAGCQTVTPCV